MLYISCLKYEALEKHPFEYFSSWLVPTLLIASGFILDLILFSDFIYSIAKILLGDLNISDNSFPNLYFTTFSRALG